jgi:hypothetical protein
VQAPVPVTPPASPRAFTIVFQSAGEILVIAAATLGVVVAFGWLMDGYFHEQRSRVAGSLRLPTSVSIAAMRTCARPGAAGGIPAIAIRFASRFTRGHRIGDILRAGTAFKPMGARSRFSVSAGRLWDRPRH